MMHAKFQDHRTFGSGVENLFFDVFFRYGEENR